MLRETIALSLILGTACIGVFGTGCAGRHAAPPLPVAHPVRDVAPSEQVAFCIGCHSGGACPKGHGSDVAFEKVDASMFLAAR
jgi:hypothetical protein